MQNEIAVKKDELDRVYKSLSDAMQTMQLILAQIGCPHRDAQEISTMDGTSIRTFLCGDCGETIEEEINYEELEQF